MLDCAKNSLLPILAACILVEGRVELKRVPKYSDVLAMCNILENLGAKICWQGSSLFVDGSTIDKAAICHELACPVRSSIFTLGPLLARLGKAKVAYPGGCDIGLRPIDLHLSSLRQLGCKIIEKNGYIYGEKGSATDQSIMLKFASVGATENIMMFATLLPEQTKIVNAAKEPEIANLIDLLNDMGARIEGKDTSILTIEGVKKLHGAEISVVPDRIEAGSYAVAAAITHGKIELINARAEHLQQPLRILEKMGIGVEEKNSSIIIDGVGKHIIGEDIYTDYYPGFPTDLQAQFMALMTIADGASLVTESIWENRFMHVPELCRMGANINIHGHASAIVRGVKKLSGAPVMATDLRASFALVLAGLVAEGETIVNRVYHLDRGYERLEEKLKGVGANIERIRESD